MDEKREDLKQRLRKLKDVDRVFIPGVKQMETEEIHDHVQAQEYMADKERVKPKRELRKTPLSQGERQHIKEYKDRQRNGKRIF